MGCRGIALVSFGRAAWPEAMQSAHAIRGNIRHHGLPDSIVSDRDKLFTGKFFPALRKLFGTKRRMSTGYYHPETDGQTERTDRVLREVLRHVSSIVQDED